MISWTFLKCQNRTFLVSFFISNKSAETIMLKLDIGVMYMYQKCQLFSVPSVRKCVHNVKISISKSLPSFKCIQYFIWCKDIEFLFIYYLVDRQKYFFREQLSLPTIVSISSIRAYVVKTIIINVISVKIACKLISSDE